jgi:type III secretion protein D
MSSHAKLHVLSGRHAGATQALPEGEVTLGSSLNADIVLTDQSILPVHATLDRGRFRVAIQAVDGCVKLGEQTLALGERVRSPYPARIQLGDVELECISASRAAALANSPGVVTLASIFVIILALSVARAFWPETSGGNVKYSAPQAPSLKASAANGSSSESAKDAIKKLEAAKVAANALTQKLLAGGIQSVEVSAEQGIVQARGVVAQPSEDSWRSIQIWFDGSFGQEVILQSEVTIAPVKARSAPIGIQAVWAGRRPYLIDDHGEKYFEGAMLKDGWTIGKIEEKKVTLTRKDEVLSLQL